MNLKKLKKGLNIMLVFIIFSSNIIFAQNIKLEEYKIVDIQTKPLPLISEWSWWLLNNEQNNIENKEDIEDENKNVEDDVEELKKESYITNNWIIDFTKYTNVEKTWSWNELNDVLNYIYIMNRNPICKDDEKAYFEELKQMKEDERQKEIEEKNKKSDLWNLLTDNQIVIWKTQYKSVLSIPKWKNDIMNEFNLTVDEKLFYSSINNIECWDETWFCVSPGGWNAGPFQMNKIHGDNFYYSKKLINEWNKEELYRFQLNWTINRMKSGEKRICNGYKQESLFTCLYKFHNWNNTVIWTDGTKYKDLYATKALLVYKFLKDNL